MLRAGASLEPRLPLSMDLKLDAKISKLASEIAKDNLGRTAGGFTNGVLLRQILYKQFTSVRR